MRKVQAGSSSFGRPGKIVVAVITTDRPETLAITLASLSCQTRKDFDVIVYDNGNTPATMQFTIPLLMDTLALQGRKVSYERLEIKPVAAAKKVCIVRSRDRGYRYVLLSDDDNLFACDYVDKVHALMLSRGAAVVEGVHFLVGNTNGHADYSAERREKPAGNDFLDRHYLYKEGAGHRIELFADYSSSLYDTTLIYTDDLDKVKGAGGGYVISFRAKGVVFLETAAVCYEINNLGGSNWKKLMRNEQIRALEEAGWTP